MKDQIHRLNRSLDRNLFMQQIPSAVAFSRAGEAGRSSAVADAELGGKEQQAASASLIGIAGVWEKTDYFPSIRKPIISNSASPTSRSRILVIDDELLDLELIGGILEPDYELLFANRGQAALEVAAQQIPDLILLDVMMPGLDGYEVLRRLKADLRTCDIPVMFITGREDVAAETRGLELGAVDYITKPINPAPVRARVNTQLKLKLARDRFARLASIDGLTGLGNRSYFDSMLTHESARHLRSGAELSLILLDVDHFKDFNDTYGHVCGDHCLRAVAQAITGAAVRATDIVARYGGEEFVLLLPETHLKGAVVLAEKVRRAIANLSIPHETSTYGYVTASLGVASARLAQGSSMLDIVEEADVQLYAAKAAGRNRIASRCMESQRLAQ